LARAASHPRGDQETRQRAEAALSQNQEQAPPGTFQQLVEAGSSTELLSMAKSTRSELLHLEMEAEQQIMSAESDTATGVIVDQLEQQGEQLVEPLTNRELEVLALIAQGLSNKQVAETLIVSTGTVKWYTSQIYGKLGVNSRTQAIARARELNLIP
jgi:ATP/maltotriose-dependent transcriptional regulator MalT